MYVRMYERRLQAIYLRIKSLTGTVDTVIAFQSGEMAVIDNLRTGQFSLHGSAYDWKKKEEESRDYP